jgi:hypothetical protein
MAAIILQGIETAHDNDLADHGRKATWHRRLRPASSRPSRTQAGVVIGRSVATVCWSFQLRLRTVVARRLF